MMRNKELKYNRRRLTGALRLTLLPWTRMRGHARYAERAVKVDEVDNADWLENGKSQESSLPIR
jgi:hypothetical protein